MTGGKPRRGVDEAFGEAIPRIVLMAAQAVFQGENKRIFDAVMNIYIKTMTEDHGNEVVAQACVSIVDVMKDIWIHSVLHPPQDRTTRSCSAYGCPNCRKYIDVSAFVADMVKENQIRYDDLALDSNRTQELAGIGSLAKGFRQYLIWDRRRTFKRVN
ncbi:unnamed protein product [Camellia sinensis]